MKIWQSGRESTLLDHIIIGNKTVEGRLNRNKFSKYRVGDYISLRRDYRDNSGKLCDGEPDQATVQIVAIRKYRSFSDLVLAEGYKNVIPDSICPTEAIAEYDRFYSQADQQKYGVLAIKIKLERPKSTTD